MTRHSYYKEIDNIIESLEVSKKIREIKANKEKLIAYWNIGKLIVEAQGGEKKARYGNELIKNWSIRLCKNYGSNYSERFLRKTRQFYILFPKWSAVRAVSWSHIREILPIKDENARNYYLNQVILNNLSSRDLIKEIKNKSFERLSYTDKENIKLIEDDNYNLSFKDMIKDPILIKINKCENNISEKVLHKYIIEMLENKFLELGMGFTLAGHEYKINVENHTYRLDLLFFNYKLNAFVVVEVKTKVMKVKDVDQLKFYVSLVDNLIKEKSNEKTIGLLIVKEHDNFFLKYATNNQIFAAKYEITNNY